MHRHPQFDKLSGFHETCTRQVSREGGESCLHTAANTVFGMHMIIVTRSREMGHKSILSLLRYRYGEKVHQMLTNVMFESKLYRKR